MKKNNKPMVFKGHKSLIEPLLQHINDNPQTSAVTFIHSSNEESGYTYEELYQGTIHFAQKFHEAGIKPGEVVVIATRYNIELIYAFWGAIYIGAIPTIFSTIGPMTTPIQYIEQCQSLYSQLPIKRVILPFDYKKHLLEDDLIEDSIFLFIDPHTTEQRLAIRNPDPYQPRKSDIAYVQLTSGTTGKNKKGAMLSHQAVLSFLDNYVQSLQLSTKDIVVSWLPLFHDAGLIIGLISPILFGIPTVLMNPFTWLRNPEVFLRAIHRHRGTITCMPNSAFNHTAQYIKQIPINNLNLSSMRCFINGAEPVTYQTHLDFFQVFEKFGLKETALMIGYGMSESTMTVTLSKPNKGVEVEWVEGEKLHKWGQVHQCNQDSNGSVPIVSCGYPMPGTEMKIQIQNDETPGEKKIGELMIKGDALFQGYLGHSPSTSRVFGQGWFSTGDIGYIDNDQFYFLGRKNDLIIHHGMNIHPESIESIANHVHGIYKDHSVAIGIFEPHIGTEQIILLSEIQRKVQPDQFQSIENKIRTAVTQRLGITLSEVHLLKKGWIIRTANGKIARKKTKNKYMKEFAG